MTREDDAPSAEPEIELAIEGATITEIASFYRELNRVFMADEDWQLGESLDALNDLLYGGYGAAKGKGPVVLRWTDIDLTRQALGVDATRAWLREKLAHPERFNAKTIQLRLDALDRGEGRTYFDMVEEIFADHPRFRIVASGSRSPPPLSGGLL